MGDPRDATLSHVDDAEEARQSVPFLFIALECDRPLAASLRSTLSGLDQVSIGRGDARTATRSTRGDRRLLAVRVPDRWMSSSHARMLRDRGAWSIADLGSKNGLIVNGKPCARAVLSDGDVLEIGHTLFLFREAPGLAAGAPLDQDGEALDAPLPELRTFVAGLGAALGGMGRVARDPRVSVMISGETGTGKELVARAVHRLSGRPGPFVAVNCGAIHATLFESELFGYRKGAFSGAAEDRDGLVRAADGGTLFLDEIGDLPAASQAALLRVLQEHEVRPVGAARPVKVDLRVVTATHRDLAAMVAEGRFRQDLLARLSGISVHLPLRERREDLGLIIASVLRKAAPTRATRLTCKAARALFRHRFPMNVRELEKGLITASALAGETTIDVPHLPLSTDAASASASASAPPADASREDRERRERLVELLRDARGNIAQVARAMGKAPMQIHRWLRRYQIDPAQFRARRG